jgi:hypothetical protein
MTHLTTKFCYSAEETQDVVVKEVVVVVGGKEAGRERGD